MKLKLRQRQKTSKRLIVALTATSVIILSAGLFVFFNFSNIKKSTAQKEKQPDLIFIPVQEFVNDFSIPAPVITHQAVAYENKLLARKVKPLPANPDSH